jgi:hypothetical protein
MQANALLRPSLIRPASPTPPAGVDQLNTGYCSVVMSFSTSGHTEVAVFKVIHSTIPPFEFGEIRPRDSEPNSRRFEYALLNRNDQDRITLLLDRRVQINVYAKAEGMIVKQVMGKPSQPIPSALIGAVSAGFVGLAMVGLFIALRRWLADVLWLRTPTVAFTCTLPNAPHVFVGHHWVQCTAEPEHRFCALQAAPVCPVCGASTQMWP